MKNNPIALALICFATMPLASIARADAAPNTPPQGFTALFNGTDLSAWWGAETEDPRKYLAMPADKFKAKHDASLANIQKHWRAENGVLVNDGKGLDLAERSTDREWRASQQGPQERSFRTRRSR